MTARSKDEKAEPSSLFECNICLDTANNPVVTKCGHLYCWRCIYEWIQQPRDTLVCPSCRSGITQDSLTPIFTRDNAEDPRIQNNQGQNQEDNEQIPNRPGGQRSDPQPNRNFGNGGNGMFGD